MNRDPQLLEGFRRGDSDALREVYVRHVDSVDTLVRLGFVTKGPPPVKVPGIRDERRRDLVHDVFLKAFRSSARLAYDGLRPYAPYLLRIAKNVCIDRFRREKRERLMTEAEVIDLDATLSRGEALPSTDADDDGAFREQAERARAFVESLDDEHQLFVQLRFRQELSQAHVAERMGVTRRRVRTLEADVLSGLRRHFEVPARVAQLA